MNINQTATSAVTVGVCVNKKISSLAVEKKPDQSPDSVTLTMMVFLEHLHRICNIAYQIVRNIAYKGDMEGAAGDDLKVAYAIFITNNCMQQKCCMFKELKQVF